MSCGCELAKIGNASFRALSGGTDKTTTLGSPYPAPSIGTTHGVKKQGNAIQIAHDVGRAIGDIDLLSRCV